MENKDQTVEKETTDVIRPEDQTPIPEEVNSQEITEEQTTDQAEKDKKEAKEKAEIIKKQKAYVLLQQGGYFLKFIYDDVSKQGTDNLNRNQRRRFSKELRKGIFSKELVDVYVSKLDVVVGWIEKNINNPEQTVNKIKTHYKINGFENPEILKALLEDYFKGGFLLPGEVKSVTEVDGK